MELITKLRLIDRGEFVRAVIDRSTETDTYKEAFDQVNEEFEGVFGKPRYADYYSFKVAKHREQKKQIHNDR